MTQADHAVEQALRARIARDRGEPVAGEEFGVEEADVRWWLDPIDGTKQYARGLPIWATLIALERDGEIVVGVASAPGARSPLVGGAGRRCVPRRGADPRLAASRASRTRTCRRRACAAFPEFAALAGRVAVARTYTDFWQYVLVAEGRIEAGSDTAQNEWDIAAPRLIVEEAGGRYTIDERLYLASNGVLHDQLRESLLPA